MLFLKLNKKNAERIRTECIRLGILDINYLVIEEGDFLYIPIKKEIRGLGNFVKRRGKKRKKRNYSIEEILKNKLNKEELKKLKTSYDLIGEIAIINIPKELEEKEKLIADAVMEIHPRIKTVVKKYGSVQGEFRTRKVKIIGGKRTKETIYLEHGCRFKLNVQEVYFSARLSSERKRIEKLISPKEKILALFAGVGPFPIVIGKKHPKTEIVAIELNPIGTKYMEENLKLNKIKNIEIITGDVNKVVPGKFKGWADRTLMPIPMSKGEFLESAIKGTKNGGIIHFYSFVDSEKPFEEAEKTIKKSAEEEKIKYTIISKRIVHSYSKNTVQIVIDFKIKR